MNDSITLHGYVMLILSVLARFCVFLCFYLCSFDGTLNASLASVAPTIITEANWVAANHPGEREHGTVCYLPCLIPQLCPEVR